MKSSRIEKLHAKELQIILESARAHNSESLSAWLAAYANMSLPYFLPMRLPQDESNSTQRFDDMIGGFPFTSSAFPWPFHIKTKNAMQPVFQINLSNAGKLLDLDFGSGILQVWMALAGEDPLLLRIIPETALSDSLESYFPDDLRHNVSVEIDEYTLRRTRPLDFEPKILKFPRVLWKPAGRMFPAQDDFVPADTTFYDDDDDLYDYIEQMKSKITTSYRGNYLGGYGGSLGSGGNFLHADPRKQRLLVRVTDEYDRSVGVVAHLGADGRISFEAKDNYLF